VHGGRDIAKGTLRDILNDIGMTIDQPAPWGWSHAAAARSPGTAWFAQCFVRLYERAGQLMGGAGGTRTRDRGIMRSKRHAW
jgi:hypothetical protein